MRFWQVSVAQNILDYLPMKYITTGYNDKSAGCIISIHREPPSLHHEEIVVKREEVAMMLTCLCEHVGKEQHHGAINARETACRKRGRPAVPPCSEEGERNHAAGVLCHHGLQSSVRSIPAPHLCKAGDPGRRDPDPHEAVSMAQTAEACVRSRRGGGARVDVHLAGELCGKRLQAAIPELLRALERDHGPGGLYAALLHMGSATTNRLLRAEKTKGATGSIVPGPCPAVSSASAMPEGSPSPGPVCTTRMTTATWRARTEPWSAGA